MSLTKVTFSMTSGAPVNVFDFGAVGDGVTDDSVAINAAITYAYNASTVANGKQVGGVVYFPKGRYLINSTLNIGPGITIVGEPSGLDPIYAYPNQSASGSEIIVSNLMPLNASGTSAAFTMTNGGPITIQDIGITGTATVTNSTALFTGNGVASAPGLSQGHFSNVRFTAFTTVFLGASIADSTFYDCGFESNVVCFQAITATYQNFNSIKFVGCIFFAGTSSVFTIPAGSVAQGILMSACIFQDQIGGGINMNGFNCYGTLEDVSITGCWFYGNSGTFAFSLLSNTANIVNISFTGNTLRNTNVVSFNNLGAGVQCYYFNCTGNVLTSSNFNTAYSVNNVVFSNNTLRATSTFTASSLNNLVINGNDFSQCSVNPPIVLTDVFTRVSISNNIFANAVTSIPINSGSTKTKMIGNVYFSDVLMP